MMAEGISGTENAFADEMNFWAKKIGMDNTNFRNSTGWPDPDLTTTAKDLNILTTELIRRFPQISILNYIPFLLNGSLPITKFVNQIVTR